MKMCKIYRIKSYEADKNIDIMKFAGKWMQPEKITFYKLRYSQNYKQDIYLLICEY